MSVDPGGDVTSTMQRSRWRDFVDQTTLHGIRYVFLNRALPVRAIWLVIILVSGGYFISIVTKSAQRYGSYPTHTLITRVLEPKMTLPTITICPLNSVEKSKLQTMDTDPDFIQYGMNQSTCAATAKIRQGHPCGLAMACCCYNTEFTLATQDITSCTIEYRDSLLRALNDSGAHFDMERFHASYGPLLTETVVLGPLSSCADHLCQVSDFIRVHHDYGDCFTLNARQGNSSVLAVENSGLHYGVHLLLDSRVAEHTLSPYSIGSKIFIHNPGEYIDFHGGIHVSPGTHTLITLFKKKYRSLGPPYGEKCRDNALKGFSYTSLAGYMYECWQDWVIEECGCRTAGYQGQPRVRVCSYIDDACIDKYRHSAAPNCHPTHSCNHVEYTYQLSSSKFPSIGTSKLLNQSLDYLTNNWAFIQIGYNSMSYELHEQKPSYEGEAFFGEIGGNLGLFLGCSLMTLVEFLDFLIAWMLTRKTNNSRSRATNNVAWNK